MKRTRRVSACLRGVVELWVHLWVLTEAFINSKRNIMAAEGGAVHNRNGKAHSILGCMESSVHPCFSQSQAMLCSLSPEGQICGLRVGPGTRNKVSLLMPRSSAEKQFYTEVNRIKSIFLASQ